MKVTINSATTPLGYCLRGFLDNDGTPMLEYHNHPNRINYPLKRIGKRGEGKWERIPWDQALDEVAAKLKEFREKYGAESVLVGTGTAHHTENVWCSWRFCNLFGTPNKIGNEQICYAPSSIPEQVTFGWPTVSTPTKRPYDLYYNPATNRDQSFPGWWPDVVRERVRGAKRIALDPRFNETARISDLWLQVRPGTDTALHLATINLMINQGIYNREFVQKWTNANLLIRTDAKPNLKVLREDDIKDGGRHDKFVVWDLKSKGPLIYNPETLDYELTEAKPALEGTYSLKLLNGSEVECKTAWQLLIERVREWSPEKTSEITWIPAHQIRQLAKILGEHVGKIVNISGYMHQAFAPGNNDNQRALIIIKILIGTMGLEGGESLVGPMPKNLYINDYEMELKTDEYHPYTLTAEQRKKQIGIGYVKLINYPAYELTTKYSKKLYGIGLNAKDTCQPFPPLVWQAVLSEKPYPIKAFIMTGTNPLQKYPDTNLVFKALMKMELLVDVEFFMTPSAMICDYVFPLADCFEKPEFNLGICGTGAVLSVGEKAVEPQFERKTDYDFYRGLGIRLGQQQYWPWMNLEEVYDYRCKPAGWRSFKELVDKQSYYAMPAPDILPQDQINPVTGRPRGFSTPSGKIELYSICFEELGCDPLPKYQEPNISPYSKPKLAREYPFILMTCVRHLPMFHSEHFMIQSVRKKHPDPLVEIHPHAAERLDPPIANGDWVWIETRKGKIKQKAKLTWGIHPRVVCIEHNWWFPEKAGPLPSLFGTWDSNANVLTESDPELCDPELGSWPTVALLCKIYKVIES